MLYIVEDGTVIKKKLCPELLGISLWRVLGKKNVAYVTEDGVELKREPLHRYKNRINRRKN